MSETLLFVLGKVVFIAVEPASLLVLICLLCVLAAARGRARAALALQSVLLVALTALAALPVGDWAIAGLEDDWPARPDHGALAGIVVLGGGEDQAVMARHGLPAVNDAGERILEGAVLARANPEVPFVLSGGIASLLDPDAPSAAGPLIPLVAALAGRAPEVEDHSRTTAENAARLAEMVGEARQGRWLLVTSAFHMTRSVESFCAAGFEAVVPWPVDYLSRDPRLRWDMAGGLRRLTLAAKERLGLAYYRVRGDAEPGCESL